MNLQSFDFLGGILIGILVFGGLLLQFFGRAATALADMARAQEKAAKSRQDTVYLLRELVTLLKSKEEKKP
ncbi:MAG: hypothetical protein WCH57_00080 [Verrucomicrobiota bacterium]